MFCSRRNYFLFSSAITYFSMIPMKVLTLVSLRSISSLSVRSCSPHARCAPYRGGHLELLYSSSFESSGFINLVGLNHLSCQYLHIFSSIQFFILVFLQLHFQIFNEFRLVHLLIFIPCVSSSLI